MGYKNNKKNGIYLLYLFGAYLSSILKNIKIKLKIRIKEAILSKK
tara:strand:+ start:406 stop:540 length:135 start_codon:yes stop_codon:yes gene_type:complete